MVTTQQLRSRWQKERSCVCQAFIVHKLKLVSLHHEQDKRNNFRYVYGFFSKC